MPETEMSEQYVFILLRVTGKNLDAREVNPLLKHYNELLRQCKIEEQRADGKKFMVWVDNIDEFQHEILDKNTLICSRQIKFEIRDPFPHSSNNYGHDTHVRIHEALMKIRVENEKTYSQRIIIETVETRFPYDFKKGRWPIDKNAGAFI
jgi:hypothetical protein